MKNFLLILPAILALIGSFLGTIITPYLRWIYDQEKYKREEKINFLDKLRSKIQSTDVKSKYFLNSNVYSRIRPFLSDDLISELEGNDHYLQNNQDKKDYLKGKLYHEIVEIENNWKIGFTQSKQIRKYKSNKVKWKITKTS